LISPQRAGDHLGDLDVLDGDSGQIGNRDLIVARATDRGVLDYTTQLQNRALLDLSAFFNDTATTEIYTL
jgi:hypothetical protein